MNLAQELRDLIVQQNVEEYEFRRAGYHLSLNPVGQYYDELGFILWRIEGDDMRPIVTGRTARRRLVVDDPDYAGDPAVLEAVLRSMITGESPVVVHQETGDLEMVGRR